MELLNCFIFHKGVSILVVFMGISLQLTTTVPSKLQDTSLSSISNMSVTRSVCSFTFFSNSKFIAIKDIQPLVVPIARPSFTLTAPTKYCEAILFYLFRINVLVSHTLTKLSFPSVITSPSPTLSTFLISHLPCACITCILSI